MIRLKGTCNRCGLCCFTEDYRCLNLEITDVPGKPFATRCLVYESRRPEMPILLVNKYTGNVEAMGVCADRNGEEETENIIKRGIGKGCSLEVVNG